jgi:hypothetical protein
MDRKIVEPKIYPNDRSKWDRKVTGQQLRVDDHGVLGLADDQGPTECNALSDLAAGQMCQRHVRGSYGHARSQVEYA